MTDEKKNEWDSYMIYHTPSGTWETISGNQDHCRELAEKLGSEYAVIPVRIEERPWDDGEKREPKAHPGVKAQARS